MQKRQQLVLQSVRLVHEFIQTNGPGLSKVMQTGTCKQLEQNVFELTGLIERQTLATLAAKGATQKVRFLRRELLDDYMTPVSRIALGKLPQVPEIEVLRMPPGEPNAAKVANAARGMADAAERFASTFIEAGLPPEFTDQLRDAAEELQAAISEVVRRRADRGAATKALRKHVSDGRKLVHILDAFVTKEIKNKPELLGKWKLLARSPRPAVAAPKESVTPSTPVAATSEVI